MAAYDNAHSRIVAWLKVLLPLAALALLSTLFLVSRRMSPEMDLPYSEVEVQEIARESRLNAPRFSGVTADGAALSVTAVAARPDLARPGDASAEGLAGRLETPDGIVTTLASASGRLDAGADLVTLQGDVRVETSAGYRMTSERLNAALDRTRLESPGTVSATAPMGRIEAGSMLMTAEGAHYVVVFKDGVKLVYRPRQPDAPDPAPSP